MSVTLTGARTDCESVRGTFDMVGNLDEWVAEWVPLSTTCSNWGGLSDDLMCLFGASTSDFGPGALLRGGDFRNRTSAGPLAVVGSGGPFSSGPSSASVVPARTATMKQTIMRMLLSSCCRWV